MKPITCCSHTLEPFPASVPGFSRLDATLPFRLDVFFILTFACRAASIIAVADDRQAGGDGLGQGCIW